MRLEAGREIGRVHISRFGRRKEMVDALNHVSTTMKVEEGGQTRKGYMCLERKKSDRFGSG